MISTIVALKHEIRMRKVYIAHSNSQKLVRAFLHTVRRWTVKQARERESSAMLSHCVCECVSMRAPAHVWVQMGVCPCVCVWEWVSELAYASVSKEKTDFWKERERESSLRRSKRRHEWIEAPLCKCAGCCVCVCQWDDDANIRRQVQSKVKGARVTVALTVGMRRAGATETPPTLSASAAADAALLYDAFWAFLGGRDATQWHQHRCCASYFIFYWFVLAAASLPLLCLWSRVNSQLLCLFEFLLRFCLRQLIFIYTYFQLNIIKLTLRARANSAALDAHFAWFLFALLVPSSSYWRQIIIVLWHRFAISFCLHSPLLIYHIRESCPQ